MDQGIIDKIRKLLARGDEARNDNPHEREIAMRQAHALLARHGLQLADVGDVDAQEVLGRLGRQACGLKTRYLWETGVWHAICELHGSTLVRFGGREQKVWVIGREIRAEAIKAMARYCVDSILNEARSNGLNVPGFGYGAKVGIWQQVNRILRAMEAGQLGDEIVSSSTALVLVSQHKNALVEAKTATKEFFPRLSKGRGPTVRDHDAYSAGRAFGSKIGLNTQIGGGSTRKQLT